MPSPDEIPAVLTIAECAAYLKVSVCTVRKSIRRQGLPAFRIGVGQGSDWRFITVEVDKWRLRQTGVSRAR
jgi:excisionase family DNA binding protein